MLNEPKEIISGLNFNVNPFYVSKNHHWHYKSEVCSCTQIGNFYMLYINQPYIENNQNQMTGLIQLLVSLACLGLLDFGPYYRYNLDGLYLYIQQNLEKIVQLSEISFAFDYNEGYGLQIPKQSKLETTLLRHQSLWCIYDKRNYLSSSYKNFRSNSILLDHPIRLELHLNLKYGSRYLNLHLLNNSVDGIFRLFQEYIFKSWKRNCLGSMPFLPYRYYHDGKVSHEALRQLKTV